MRFNNIAAALIILSLASTGCSTIKVPDAKQAAVLDTVSTAAVLGTGAGYEVNPLGFVGATLLKVVLINNMDKFEPQTHEAFKIAAATIWTAAAVNNLAVLACVPLTVSLPLTLAAGYVVYKNTLIRNKTAKQTNPKP
jgi:hypothetical protein